MPNWERLLTLAFWSGLVALLTVLAVVCDWFAEPPSQEEQYSKELEAVLAEATLRPRTLDLTATEAVDVFREELVKWAAPQNQALAAWFTRQCYAMKQEDQERWLISCPFVYTGESKLAQFWFYDETIVPPFPAVPIFTFANRVGLDVMGVLQEP